MMNRSEAAGLLARHFLRGLVHNDLQAPDADQRETLAGIGGILLTGGLFVSLLSGLKYVSTPFLTPGRAAIGVLNDTFLFVGWAFIVMALVALVKWDAMTIDERDTSIVGPLPVRHFDIVAAKLAAVTVFALGFLLALTVVPSVIHPLLVASSLRASSLPDAARLVVAHAASSLGAGLFGFAAVMAVRETTRALLGVVLFRRISALLQGVLLAAFVVMFLLLPGASTDVAQRWLGPGSALSAVTPPLWFVGLHEAIADDSVIGQPVPDVPPRAARAGREATLRYLAGVPTLRRVAVTAVTATALAVLLALAAYLWNTRRLPIADHRGATRGLAAQARALACRTIVRRQAVRAGFFFAAQTLARSVAHRSTMAAAAGVAGAVTILNARLPEAVAAASLPLSFLATQLAVVTALVVGFRQALRLPADVRATWTFELAWTGDDRPYVAGVKRAALILLVVPALAALLPLSVLVMGVRLAFWHTAFGFLAAVSLLEALMLGLRRLPFVASYLPGGKLWAGPAGVLGFLIAAGVFSAVERMALQDERRSLALGCVLLGLAAALRVVDVIQRRARPMVDLNEPPAPPTQRLVLAD